MVPFVPAGFRPRWPAMLAIALSFGLHGIGLATLVRLPDRPSGADLSRILPALYLYAPDRRPGELREARIPIPAPRGLRGNGPPVDAVAAPGGEHRRVPRPRPGLPPPGALSVRLDSVYSVLAVDSQVIRTPGSVAPIYPPELLAAGTEGQVDAEFVVDTTGRVDLATVRIIRSTHEAFTASVQSALARMEFRPAWRAFRHVRQLVQQRFSFRLLQPQQASARL